MHRCILPSAPPPRSARSARVGPAMSGATAHIMRRRTFRGCLIAGSAPTSDPSATPIAPHWGMCRALRPNPPSRTGRAASPSAGAGPEGECPETRSHRCRQGRVRSRAGHRHRAHRVLPRRHANRLFRPQTGDRAFDHRFRCQHAAVLRGSQYRVERVACAIGGAAPSVYAAESAPPGHIATTLSVVRMAGDVG